MSLHLRTLAGSAVLALAALTSAHAQGPYKVATRFTVGGVGGWDYVQANPESHRLYITHGTQVDVVDTNDGKVLGAITGLEGTHGVVIRPDQKVGFISDGRANAVVVFDTTTFAHLKSIPTGTNPDGLLYEPSQNRVWAFNGRTNNTTVIDAKTYEVLATITLPGRPEFPAADGHGAVYANIEDKGELVRLMGKELKLDQTFPLAGCEEPSGLAIDTVGPVRLFSVCANGHMAVTDGATGKQLALVAIGKGPDAAGYDPKHKVAFSSNGQDGTLTVVDASKPDYPVIETLPTEKSARTMAFDEGNGNVYLISAKFGPVDPAAPARTRPPVLAGSFGVVVVSR